MKINNYWKIKPIKPTGTVFGWDTVFLGWFKLPQTWNEYSSR